jgi:hypothetical protein
VGKNCIDEGCRTGVGNGAASERPPRASKNCIDEGCRTGAGNGVVRVAA